MGRPKRPGMTFADRVVLERLLLFSERDGQDLLRMLLARFRHADPLSSSSTYKKQYDAVSRPALQTPRQRAHAGESLRQLAQVPAALVEKSVGAVTEILHRLDFVCAEQQRQRDTPLTAAAGSEGIAQHYADAEALLLFHVELMEDSRAAYRSFDAIAGTNPTAEGLQELIESARYGLARLVMNVLQGNWIVWRCVACSRFNVEGTRRHRQFCGKRCGNAVGNPKRLKVARTDEQRRRRASKRAQKAAHEAAQLEKQLRPYQTPR